MTATEPGLAALRRAFDDVDAQLLALLAERQRLARAAGEVKRAAGLPIIDEQREAAAAAARRVRAAALGLDAAFVDDVFALVVGASRRAQGAR
jgi:chorismate mutase-like protein